MRCRGGRLRIELTNVVLDGAPITSAARNVSGTERAQALKPGRYVRLSAADTGSGMSAETLARVFEPFFTTKEEGRGTGLGLAMVYGIVEQAAGAIDVETAVDQGTVFHVYLPAVPQTDAAADAQNVGSEGPAKGIGDAVPGAQKRCRLWKTRHASPRSLPVRCGPTAIPSSRRQRRRGARGRPGSLRPIHLLLTDVVMPGMNGRELSEIVVGLRSETHVLFMSGYSDDAVLRHGIETASAHFLEKPFSIGTSRTENTRDSGSCPDSIGLFLLLTFCR